MVIFLQKELTSRNTRTGSGQTGAQNGHFLISRITRTGSGQTGARNAHFLIRGSLAGAPELVLARPGPEMVIFSSGFQQQEPQNWLWPD